MKHKTAVTSEPQPSYNQHPQYEQWKNICPNCRSKNTTHNNHRAEEFNVLLRCSDCDFTFSLEQAFKAEQQRRLLPYHTDDCAPWGERCPIHTGIYHYQCQDCGKDCTVGTPAGPPTRELDNVTRCYECNHKVPRFHAVGKAAILAKAAPDLLAALEGMIQAWSVQFENELDNCPEAVAAMAARDKARG